MLTDSAMVWIYVRRFFLNCCITTDRLAKISNMIYYSPRMYSRRVIEILYGPKNGLHAFGYNSAESEPIWMKFSTLWAKCQGLALEYFGCDLRSSDSLRGSRNFVFFVRGRFHRFPVGHILRHLNTTTSMGKAVKTGFWKFYHRDRFSTIPQKLLKKLPGLATSGRHNSAMITNAENSRPNGTLRNV